MSLTGNELAAERSCGDVAVGGAPVTAPGGPPAAAAGRELAARDIAAFLGDRQPELVFFFGYGDGAHAEALRARTTANIIFFEPRPLPGAPSPPPGVQVLDSLAALMAAAAGMNDLAARQVLAGAVPALRVAEPEAFARFTAAVRQALTDARIRSATLTRSARTWLRNLAVNLPQVSAMPPVDLLAGRFAGRPGIVVGAGPSLDLNLEVLRGLQGHVLLCAASTALPALARYGIVPELVVVIEANDVSGHFAGVPHLDRMTLLPGPLGHPAHFAVPVGARLAAALGGSVPGDWLQRARGCRQLESGGSVACVAFSALHLLGCDPLVLVGMDLALTDGRTHAGGTEQATRRVRYEPGAGRVYHWFEDKPNAGHWSAVTTPAWGGGEVLTRPIFNSYRLWFEGAAETWARDRVLVNATEGGARIHGFTESSLADWSTAAAPPPLAARELIAQVLASAPATDPEPLWREVAAELSVVAQAGEAAAQAGRLAARALKDLEAGRFGGLDGQLGRLAAAESRLAVLTRSTRLLNALVGERSLAVSRDGEMPPAADKVATTAWSLRQSGRISGIVAEGARELADLYGPLVAASRK